MKCTVALFTFVFRCYGVGYRRCFLWGSGAWRLVRVLLCGKGASREHPAHRVQPALSATAFVTALVPCYRPALQQRKDQGDLSRDNGDENHGGDKPLPAGGVA